MEHTLPSLAWLITAFVVILFQTWISFFETKVPETIRAAYLFGKLKKTKKSDLESKTLIPIPKSWFTHFYAVGIVVHSIVVTAFILHFTETFPALDFIDSVRRLLQWPQTTLSEKNALSVAIVLIAEWFQMARRLYECLFVSSFSKGTMSLIHYALGLLVYSTFGLGLLTSVDVPSLTFSYSPNDAMYLIPAFFMFVCASYFQDKTFRTFASLRKGEKGKSAKGHFIPKGHLFSVVSCPHYLCEMIIYFSLCLVFKMTNAFLNSLLWFVIVNQISSAIMSHNWYKKTFSNYPKSRNAVFPFLL